MTWVTWRQYRHQGALAAALLAVLAVLLLLTGLHAAQVWHSALAQCAKDGSCASLAGSGLSLGSPTVTTLVLATAAAPAPARAVLGDPGGGERTGHRNPPVRVYYKLTAPFAPAGSYLTVSQGALGPNGKPPVSSPGASAVGVNGVPVPAACHQFIGGINTSIDRVLSCMAAHGYREYLTYQPANRFWAFQGIETGIFVALAAVLLGATFWVLKRRDA